MEGCSIAGHRGGTILAVKAIFAGAVSLDRCLQFGGSRSRELLDEHRTSFSDAVALAELFWLAHRLLELRAVEPIEERRVQPRGIFGRKHRPSRERSHHAAQSAEGLGLGWPHGQLARPVVDDARGVSSSPQ